MDDPELKQLLRDIAPLSGRTNGRRYPRRLQKRIIAYCARRRADGVSLRAVVGELGVSLPTLQRWCEAAPTAPTRFREVAIASATGAIPSPSRALVVHGPAGLRIEGLDVAALAQLWRSLS